jgi:hypothetical protein
VRGIEPLSLTWKASALPLSYTRGGIDFRLKRGSSSEARPHSRESGRPKDSKADYTPLGAWRPTLVS